MSELIVSPTVSFYIGGLVQWGFLMAFLYSLAHSINKPNKERVYLSLVMSASYSFSIFTNMDTVTYLDFLFSDILTLLVIIFLRRLWHNGITYLYIITGLAINSALHFFMHYDIYILNNTNYWWLWNAYAIGINAVDFIMVAIFFINKDFLCLMKLKNGLITSLKRTVGG
ncbi:hypothetical protein [Pseudoalteromonas sp. SWN166]|uniref:hypothetical protein n=1 Tax=Pseudoalteromonas sp. SWN166 TaxID=2792061 RepID=UPI0018CEE269|nr:hypothetical protein [Pseudoalteromonas sp. SWN166]MBH0038611.1 hypothetical protein [Pseudoalteromonas sp. SWN166]